MLHSIHYYRYVNSLQYKCKSILRLGTIEDGGWDVCDDYEFRPKNSCVVYSFGIDNDFSFDEAVVKRYGCEVHSFDPRLRGKQWKMKTLKTIRRDLDHIPIDILKLDIEEWEWFALPEMIYSGSIKDVKQLNIELHLSIKILPNYKRYLRCLYILKDLHDLGFRIFWTHRNLWCTFYWGDVQRTGCHEVSMTCCRRIVRMGKIDDGGWDTCDDYRYRPQSNCLVFSFGINNDFSFDDDISKTYGCKKKIDILKIDIEMWEWTVLPEMISSGVLDKVTQFVLEFHIVNIGTNSEPLKQKYIEGLSVLRKLYDLGFRIFWTHKNLNCKFFSQFGGQRCGCHENSIDKLKSEVASSDPFNDTVLIPGQEYLNIYFHNELSQLYHNYISSLQILCRRVVRLGSLADGGWDMCGDFKYKPRSNCLVYSFGIKDDFSFDDDCSTRYKCEVHSFDPRQLLIELHIVNIQTKEEPTKEKYISSLVSLKQLYDLGFRIFWTHRNLCCKFTTRNSKQQRTGCQDVAFIFWNDEIRIYPWVYLFIYLFIYKHVYLKYLFVF
ncbi:hypothetical protein KUTeg_016297 [Tegillarca granosa]|uniref:Methyltransferase domain-containing protein n=1 Tax=Tegillarca granosa TaxID=220873 RepID=A0ABQ9EKG5_TEGGR|nr:hypothetical protein KUTeg_016297 [Tegillarca granosa]